LKNPTVATLPLMVKLLANDPRAIVRPSVAFEHFTMQQWAPDPPMDRFVARYWKTAWDLPEPFVQPIVMYPAVNVVVQADGSAVVTGVQRKNDQRELQGKGWALGALFRSGGFRPLVAAPMSELVDQRMPMTQLFGQEAAEFALQVVDSSDDHERLALFSTFFVTRAPAQRTVGEDISDLVEWAVSSSPTVTTVTALASHAGVSERTLQRLFLEHVGISPKQVLNRLRVQAAAAAAQAPVASWADVAHQLGYADQAHLTSEVGAAYGAPPAAYARGESRERLA
jgi:AraC-like DNA-binding protein